MSQGLVGHTGRIGARCLKRAIHEHKYAARIGVHVGMHRTRTRDTGPSPAQVLAGHGELAFKNIDEFRKFMFMQRQSCTRLEPHDLHLQATGNRDVFDKYAGGEGGWLPGQVITRQTQKFTVFKLDHYVHPQCAKDDYQPRVSASDRGALVVNR